MIDGIQFRFRKAWETTTHPAPRLKSDSAAVLIQDIS
jgi:hypothetical protein